MRLHDYTARYCSIWAIKPFHRNPFKCFLILGFLLAPLVLVKREKSIFIIFLNIVSSACAVFTVISFPDCVKCGRGVKQR